MIQTECYEEMLSGAKELACHLVLLKIIKDLQELNLPPDEALDLWNAALAARQE